MSIESTEKLVSAVLVGERIKFRTISPHDTTIYVGEVICFGNYSVAKLFDDVGAIQQDMLQQDPDIPDIAVLQYIVVDCHDGKRRPFAFNWIQNGKVEVVAVGNTKLVRLYNVSTAKAAEAIAILRQNDISCQLI